MTDGALDQALATFDLAAEAGDGRRAPLRPRADPAGARGRPSSQAGRRGDALADLRAALDGFAALGARPFVDLAAAGPRRRSAPRRPSAPHRGLRPSLRRSSRSVAWCGKASANREIATELFLSTKTVEFHLRHVYMKLGIRSRTQLVARSAELLDLRTVAEGEADRSL